MGLFSRKKKTVDTKLYAFATGDVVTLDGVPDQVFSTKMMGDGLAIEPTSSKIVAPCDGVLSVVFPTGHAYGIERGDGVEVLVHLGLDTVELDGKGFTVHVKKGDTVTRGDVLCEVDWDYIRSQDKPTVSPIIVTSGQSVQPLYENPQIDSYETALLDVSE